MDDRGGPARLGRGRIERVARAGAKDGDMMTTHGYVGHCVRAAARLCALVACVAVSVGVAWGGPGVGRAGEASIGLGPRSTDGAAVVGPDQSVGIPGVSGAVGVGGLGVGGGVGGVIQTAGPLLLVVCLAVVGLRLMRRVSGGGGQLADALGARGKAPSGVIEVLGRYPVARGQLLVLVKLDRRVLLLGHSAPARGAGGGPGGGFVTLAEVTDPEEVAGLLVRVREGRGESVGARFGAMLRSAGAAAAFDGQARGEAAWEEPAESVGGVGGEPVGPASAHAAVRAAHAQPLSAPSNAHTTVDASDAPAGEWGRVRERLASLRGRSAGVTVGGVA